MSENLLRKFGGIFRRETPKPVAQSQPKIPEAVVRFRGLACSLDEETHTYKINPEHVEQLPDDQRNALVEDLWKVVLDNNLMPGSVSAEATNGIHSLRK